MKQIIFAVAITGLFTTTACNHSAIKERDAAIQARQHTIDSMNAEIAKRHIIDSMNEYTRLQFVTTATLSASAQPVNQAPKVVYVKEVNKHRYAGHGQRRSSAYDRPVAQAPVSQKKRGWSAKATGAVVGAGTGGVAGALINGRNRTAGAVIGTVLGAGAGLGIGAIIDKKNGR